MRRRWALLGVGVLFLCAVGILPVLAQGPGGNPIFATVDYVDQKVSQLYAYIDQQVDAVYDYVDEQIGGGGGVAPPAWEVAEGYEWYYAWPEEDTEVFLRSTGASCALSEDPTVPIYGTLAWGVAHLPDREVYLRRDCTYMEPWLASLYAEDLPEYDVEIEIWVEWLGELKHATYTVSPIVAVP